MKPGTVIRFVLLGIIVLAVGLIIFKEWQRTQSLASPQAQGMSIHGEQVLVYYFHSTRRCATCRKFENYTEELLNSQFADWLQAGALVWMPCNIDEAENAHFPAKYELHSKAVILSHVKNGKELRHQNLDEIWDRIGDRENYEGYVSNEIRVFLQEAGL